MKLITMGLVMALATGCSSYGHVKKVVAEDGANASDEALEANEWYMCKAAPVGSVKRKYQTAEDRAAYNQLCGDELP